MVVAELKLAPLVPTMFPVNADVPRIVRFPPTLRLVSKFPFPRTANVLVGASVELSLIPTLPFVVSRPPMRKLSVVVAELNCPPPLTVKLLPTVNNPVPVVIAWLFVVLKEKAPVESKALLLIVTVEAMTADVPKYPVLNLVAPLAPRS